MTAADAGGADRLRIFLAMPGTDMGPDATWKNPDEVKQYFYDKIAAKVGSETGREVELIVEKDKTRSGPIYSSMYSEAWLADVYLADLTGANANVYLELGVRWAISDGVTILLAQDPSKLKFNVVAARAEPYSMKPAELERSIERVVRSVVDGLVARERGETDSPVRENGKVLSIAAADLAALRSDVERLRSERGEDYLRMAAEAETIDAKVQMLRRAVEVNPLVAESNFRLGELLRGTADAEAVEYLRTATRLDPGTPRYWRGLGIALSKSGRPDDAVPAFQKAIELDPSDFDAVSALGGAQRRIALARAPAEVGWDQLRAARESYERASSLSPNDTYPLLNVARIDLLLSQVDPTRADAAGTRFQKVLPLCQYKWTVARDDAAIDGAGLQEQEDLAYKAFDHADCLLFSGRTADGITAYQDALDVLPPELRTDVVRSVLAGLDSIDAIARLDTDVADAVSRVRELLTA